MHLPVRAFFYPARFQRRRELLISGKVTVRKGQFVEAEDVIAEAALEANYRYLDLARGLGVKPDQVNAYLQVKVGSHIEAGDLIAGPVGSAQRVVRATGSCTVLGLENGQVLLETGADCFRLAAGFPGNVVDLLAERGAVVESSGILLQGAWGNGRWSHGRLAWLVKTPQHVLAPSQLVPALTGALVLAGHCENPEALVKAESIPIGGLVLSSLSPFLVDSASRLSFPVMVLEGFGKHPLNPGLFRWFSEFQAAEAILSAEQNPSYRQARPELLVQAPVGLEMALLPVEKEAEAGQRVRVTTTPYLGKVGVLVRVADQTRLPNGIVVEAGMVRLDSGESLLLPLANLEIIEQM